MDRRQFLKTTAVQAAILGPVAGCAVGSSSTPGVDAGTNPFQHGIASGDPQTDRVILWTRVSPVRTISGELPGTIAAAWWIAKDAEGRDVVNRGDLVARSERDFTLKVDASRLSPGRTYYYGFTSGGHASAVGRTRTLPNQGVENVRLAVTSCANYPQGYFNAYREIADSENFDAVLSLGDYIYEYAEGEYGDGAALDRVPEPIHEIVTLDDYRLRHAQHKAEPDLQAAHAAHPWIVVWDDHESANNSWSDGAQNHNPDKGEGTWDSRRTAAIAAYYEWMPIRELPTGMFRSFRFGELADLVMLDTRLEGRDEQGAREDLVAAKRPGRQLLGRVQENRFFDHLTSTQADGVRWKLVGQQVVFAPWAVEDSTSFNPDSWDGYRDARRRVLEHIEQGDVSDVVILTGDVHSSWGMEVPSSADDDATSAIELVAPAVSSPPLATGSQAMDDLVRRATQETEHVKFADGWSNGYLIVDLDAQRANAQWRFTGPRTEQSDTSTLGQSLQSPTGSSRLV